MSKFYVNFHQSGNNVNIREIENGVTKNVTIPIKPTLFTKTMEKDAEFFSIYKDPLKKVSFESPKEARDFAKSYPEHMLFGYKRFAYDEIDNYYSGNIEYDPEQINIMYFDIETTTENGFPSITEANEEVSLITFISKGRTITLTTRPVTEGLFDTEILLLSSEEDLLRTFVSFIDSETVHVLSGWNIKYFDVPYIINRIERILGPAWVKALSPFKRAYNEESFNEGRSQIEGKIDGIIILDYLELYQKFELSPRDNYKLDYIGEVEVGQRKLQYEGTFKGFYSGTYYPSEDPGENGSDLYKKAWSVVLLKKSKGESSSEYLKAKKEYEQMSWDTFVRYNIVDTILVKRIDDKLKFINIAMNMAYLSKCNFDDVYMVTRIWDNIIHIFLKKRNKFSHYNSNFSSEDFEGAYVKPTVAGYYKWLSSFDFESLYPKLIVQFNISPDTMLPKTDFIRLTAYDCQNETEHFKYAVQNAKNKNATLCANGAMFSKDEKGFMAELTEEYFDKRKAAKNSMKDWAKLAEAAKKELERRKLNAN